jgi:YesN/AraC family two-component response regulator
MFLKKWHLKQIRDSKINYSQNIIKNNNQMILKITKNVFYKVTRKMTKLFKK